MLKNQAIYILLGIVSVLLISACQTGSNNNISTTPSPIRTAPVNVHKTFVLTQTIEPQALLENNDNLFSNGGFENNLDGWVGCSDSAIRTSSDAYEGTGALEVLPDNCFYKSAEISAEEELTLSCYVKLLAGNEWTGLGLGFADSNWNSLEEAPATVITSTTYERYSVSFTAPANSTYVSMWLYSENSAVVDTCSLTRLKEPPPPPPSTGNNLLKNSGFTFLNEDNLPKDWAVGCGGRGIVTEGRLQNGVQLSDGACMDQSINARTVAGLVGEEFSYICTVKNTLGYSSMSIFFDNELTTKKIPITDGYELIKITGVVPRASTGFVSVYSEGELIVDFCQLTRTSESPRPVNPPIDPRPMRPADGQNILFNPSMESTSGISDVPVGWFTRCGGEGYTSVDARTGNKAYLIKDGACLDQTFIDYLVDMAGKTYTLSCYVKKSGGYAAISTFFADELQATVEIPDSVGYQKVSLTSIAPSSVFSRSYISLYSEGTLKIDDCSFIY